MAAVVREAREETGLEVDVGPLVDVVDRIHAALREQSRAFLAPWEPEWPADDLTRGAFRNRLRRYANELQEDSGYSFLIFRTGDHAGRSMRDAGT